MKKILTMLFSLLTVVILSSCDEVKDSPLLFKATSNTNPEYISVSYYPEEIGYTLYPKESKYFIYSYTYIDGDLELTCTLPIIAVSQWRCGEKQHTCSYGQSHYLVDTTILG